MIATMRITDTEIAKMVHKHKTTIWRWKRDQPDHYEIVYLGCLAKRNLHWVLNVKGG